MDFFFKIFLFPTKPIFLTHGYESTQKHISDFYPPPNVQFSGLKSSPALQNIISHSFLAAENATVAVATDTFPIGNGSFRIGTIPFPIENEAVAIGNAPFRTGNATEAIGTVPFPIENDTFSIQTAPFSIRTGTESIGNVSVAIATVMVRAPIGLQKPENRVQIIHLN